MPVDAKTLINWQTMMSNSAHQREVADLKAAGLNPVLSARLGGASTPSGAMDDISAGAAGRGSGSGSGYKVTENGIESDGTMIGDFISGLDPIGYTQIGKWRISNNVLIAAYNGLKDLTDGEPITMGNLVAAVRDQTGYAIGQTDFGRAIGNAIENMNDSGRRTVFDNYVEAMSNPVSYLFNHSSNSARIKYTPHRFGDNSKRVPAWLDSFLSKYGDTYKRKSHRSNA